MAYALHFGFPKFAGLLSDHGAQIDLRFASGLGRIEDMRPHFRGSELVDPQHAGRLGDPYEDRFRCERTRENVLNQSLFFACMNGRLETAAFLIDRGADVNAFIPGLDAPLTILHWLTTSGQGKQMDNDPDEQRRLPIMEYLIEREASLEIRDPRYGATPAGWAEYMGRKRMAALLKAHVLKTGGYIRQRSKK